MQKQFHRIAVALWVAAAVYFLGKLAVLPLAASFPKDFAAAPLGQEARYLLQAVSHFLDLVRILDDFNSAILGAAQLVALGTLVELLDRIRRQASAQCSS